MEGVSQFSGYVRKYVASLLNISLQAREFPIITRYDVIINIQFFRLRKEKGYEDSH
jgi:hypothetical protein